MHLQINDDYRVVSDPNNIILEQRTIIKTGKREGETEWKTIGYFPTLEYALEKLLDKWIRDSEINTNSIQELVKVIKSAKDEICDAVKLSSAG
jgi:hypothetical protein